MRAVFYTFSKRINSTAQPSGGTEYNISLKGDTGILSPEVSLQWTGSGNPCAFNYAWLPDFSRYYWIKNWTYSERQWIASLAVDVLASWKTAIGSTNKYILRSASDYDPEVLDTVYPATGDLREYAAASAIAFPSNPLTGGSFILNVAGTADSNVLTIGGCGFYVCTPAEMQAIARKAFNDVDGYFTNNQPSQTSNWLEEIMLFLGELYIRGTSDIAQYINGITWMPIAPGDISDQSIKSHVFLGLIDCGTASVLTAPTITKRMSFDLSSFGDISSAAAWEWVSPYADYYFKMLPFGSVPLDSVSVYNCMDNLNAAITIDMISGLAVLELYGVRSDIQEPGQNTITLATRTAQMGVPLQVAGVNVDYMSAVSEIVSGVAGGVVAASAGSPMIAAGNILGGVGNAVNSMLPAAHTAGRSGGTAAIQTTGEIRIRKVEHVPQDITENGRPLCQIRTINTLSGYIQTRDGDITAPATDGELDQISNYLTGGFFYE